MMGKLVEFAAALLPRPSEAQQVAERNHTLALRAMPDRAIDVVRAAETFALQFPQAHIAIEHDLHGGMYHRTAHVPAKCRMTGALIRVPTLLIVEGETLVYIGEDEPLHLRGYTVLQAAAGRKQAFETISEVRMTMIFPTSARTKEEAEAEFTEETHMLTTRRETA